MKENTVKEVVIPYCYVKTLIFQGFYSRGN